MAQYARIIHRQADQQAYLETEKTNADLQTKQGSRTVLSVEAKAGE